MGHSISSRFHTSGKTPLDMEINNTEMGHWVREDFLQGPPFFKRKDLLNIGSGTCKHQQRILTLHSGLGLHDSCFARGVSRFLALAQVLGPNTQRLVLPTTSSAFEDSFSPKSQLQFAQLQGVFSSLGSLPMRGRGTLHQVLSFYVPVRMQGPLAPPTLALVTL